MPNDSDTAQDPSNFDLPEVGGINDDVDRELVVDIETAEITIAVPDPALLDLAADLATTAAQAVAVIEGISHGRESGSSISILLLEISNLLAAGSRLGALSDIVPADPLEPDSGPEPEVDGLRDRLAELFAAFDDYTEVVEPYSVEVETSQARLSDDLATIVSDLLHGLAHQGAGRPVEALWWWQFSYLQSWGPAASGAVRALQALVAHLRFDALD